MKRNNEYDYIIAGAGCAGLSLLVRMLQSGKFSNKEILLIDKEPKKGNDRTWCFWEKDEGPFEPIVHKSWQQLWIHGKDYSGLHDIAPYRYKMIRGEDFYTYCFNIIKQHPNVFIKYGTVDMATGLLGGSLMLDGQFLTADYIFSSTRPSRPIITKNDYFLLQHFKGWVIETPQPAFTVNEATLMDFRAEQQHGTTFVYVMPLSPNKALVEYTLFSKELLQPQEYEEGLKSYIRDVLHITDYTVLEEEFGIIPMTDGVYYREGEGVVYIGTAGGQTKASTGYTFSFIQKQTQRIVDTLLINEQPGTFPIHSPRRFRWYDSTLLNILSRNKLPGSFIFTELFKKNKATDVLQFLDNETRFLQEMKIITVLPKTVFMKAALKEWSKYYGW